MATQFMNPAVMAVVTTLAVAIQLASPFIPAAL